MQVDSKASLGGCAPCTRPGLEPELRRCRRKWYLAQSWQDGCRTAARVSRWARLSSGSKKIKTVDLHTLFCGRAMVGLMEREKKYEKEIKGLHVRRVCSAKSHPPNSPTYFHEIHVWQILSGNFLEYGHEKWPNALQRTQEIICRRKCFGSRETSLKGVCPRRWEQISPASFPRTQGSRPSASAAWELLIPATQAVGTETSPLTNDSPSDATSILHLRADWGPLRRPPGGSLRACVWPTLTWSSRPSSEGSTQTWADLPRPPTTRITGLLWRLTGLGGSPGGEVKTLPRTVPL